MKITLEQVLSFMQERIAFNRFLGIEVAELSKGFCRLELPFRDELVGDPFRPALHGGVLSALIDTAGGAAVWTEIDTFDRVSTVDLRVDYLRPAPLERIACEARVLRIGNRVGVTDMSCFAVAAREKVACTGKGVYSVRRHGGPATGNIVEAEDE